MPKFLTLVVVLACANLSHAASPGKSPVLLQQAAKHGDGLWKQIATGSPRPETGSRAIIGYALALCEARMHPERLHRLFALLRSMQDTDPKSRNYGNLKWYWRDPGVTDLNAIDFCMQDALTIVARHGEWLPAEAREELDAFIRLGTHGCLQHRVPTDYTNIAILNAANLIVAGERGNRPEAAAEGRMRLDGIIVYTAAFGIHEYCSPTYYGTDLSGLLMLHTLGREPRERAQAEAMLKLFWTDIAANWVAHGQKLGGCHSRSYDYLRGIGALDWQLWSQGWLQDAKAGSAERREPWGDEWSPPQEIIALRDSPLPRFVEQRWGALPAELRWHWVAADVSLSCAGACYGSQDAPLTVDLPGDRNAPRLYFIPDGREDPYGKKKYATGAAKHDKALHLQPFWAGAQNKADALGLVLYRPSDLREPKVTHLQSHFVLRWPIDGVWVDGQRVDTIITASRKAKSELAAKRLEIDSGKAIVFRYGSAAVGVRVPWTYHGDEMPGAKVALTDDGNDFDCLRLTIDHGAPPPELANDANLPIAGAALWVRVGSRLANDAAFEAWRKQFEAATVDAAPKLRCMPKELAQSAHVPKRLLASESTGENRGEKEPIGPPDCVLRIDGHEVGRQLLQDVEPLKGDATVGVTFWKPMRISSTQPTSLRASRGLVLPGIRVVKAFNACMGEAVLQEPSELGQPAGSVWWRLDVKKAGNYWLWARVQTKDDKRGSFAFAVSNERGYIVAPNDWPLHSAGKWSWKRLQFAGSKSPAVLDLPGGVCLMQVRTKQSGVTLDRLWISSKEEERPEE